MQVFKLENMIRGWFVGNFDPTVHRTDQFEVGYRVHQPDEGDDAHFHPIVTEVNVVTHGRMIVQDQVLVAGDIFVLHPWEITNPVFLETTGVICVKVPSLNDKISFAVNNPELLDQLSSR